MYKKKYRFLDTVIQVITPEIICDEQPFAQFICDDEPDYTVVFEYKSELPKVPQDVTTDSEISFITDCDKSLCWYRNHGKDGYFACRICNGEDCRVQVLEEYRGKLWNGIIFNLMGFEEIVAEKNGIVLHASAVLTGGKMILFTAPCGTGKSTQAELWKKYAGAEIVNGDKALIKLCTDKVLAGGLPFSGTSDICKNISAPLTAIVYLGQAKENILRKMSVSEAFISLLQGNYRSGMRKSASQKTIEALEQVCRNIPVYKFDCLPDITAVDCLRKELGI